jgi:predicted N-formylglutamate amidohydrolase
MFAGKQAIGIKVLLTSEHGGNEVPSKYSRLFKSDRDVLNTHRAFDPGSLDLCRHLRELSDFSLENTTTRLLIELNRSLQHPRLFSEYSKVLGAEEKKKLIDDVYLLYRHQVERWIKIQIQQGFTVYHFSIHSFTNVLDGIPRKADIAWLYDPGRPIERELCKAFRNSAKQSFPELRLRMNYPYKGVSDGFTKYLRAKFPHAYAGIELEVNQSFVKDNTMDASIKVGIKKSLKTLLSESPLSFKY